MHFVTLTFRMVVNIHFQTITVTNFWKAIYTITIPVSSIRVQNHTQASTTVLLDTA